MKKGARHPNTHNSAGEAGLGGTPPTPTGSHLPLDHLRLSAAAVDCNSIEVENDIHRRLFSLYLRATLLMGKKKGEGGVSLSRPLDDNLFAWALFIFFN